LRLFFCLETLSKSFAGAVGGEEWFTHGWLIQLTLLTFVLFPLSMLSTVGALKYTSVIALGGIMFLVVCILVKFASNVGAALSDEDDKFLSYFNWGSGIFASIPILTFAFSMHMQLFIVWSELEKPTPRRITRIVLLSIVICGCVYAAVGAFGYLTFFDLTHNNILVNYDQVMLF
jgi:amino acid permease